nr:ATP-binding protein [Streptomyces canus]
MSAELLEVATVCFPSEDQDLVGEGSVGTAEQARELTRGFLSVAAPEGGSGVDDVVLVVSELCTNAVRHAGGMTGFRLKAGPGTVTVEVRDASSVPPLARPWDAGKPGGFGWPVVQELSLEVRVLAHVAGKTVTATVPCPSAAARQGSRD